MILLLNFDEFFKSGFNERYWCICHCHLSWYDHWTQEFKMKIMTKLDFWINLYFMCFSTKLTLLLINRYVLHVALRRLVDGEIPCPPRVWYWLRSVPERLQLLLWQTKILNNELSLIPMKDFNLVLAEYKSSIFTRNLLGRRPAPPRGFLAAIIRT